jgi:hypothetical protein
MESFFKENANKSTAWNAVRGDYIRFSVSCDIFKRDEAEIKKLTAKYGLKTIRLAGFITFLKN